MPDSPMSGVVRQLRRVIFRREAEGLSDGQLLDCFLARREEAAFEALVRRHGPMVLGVCRRVLRHNQDAEDAFQATFLVLARKAESVSPRERVGPWLHGVACRTAFKARAIASRRRRRERPLHESALPSVSPEEGRPELAARLDDAIRRLPEKYRTPLVLCELQGEGRREAARRLRLPEGTLSSRLARAKQLLARRLQGRGLLLLAPAVVPAALIPSTVEAALGPAGTVPAPVAALVQGVLQTMLLTRLKIATVLVAALVTTAVGVGQLGRPALLIESYATAADKPKVEVGPTIPATVQSVDAGKQTLTALVQAEKGKKERVAKTYGLAKDVPVVLVHGLKKETKNGTLADLAAGTDVSLQLSPDEKTVLRVEVHGGSLHGSIKAVDGDKNTLTVITKTKDGPVEKTVALAKEAKVWLDDGLVKGGAKEGKLSDLAEGTPVVVHLSGYDRKTAIGVSASGPTVHGTLKGVDASANTITVSVKETVVEDRTYDLARGARADSGKVTDISAGAIVSLRLSVFDKKTVVAVHVHKEGD
jgi:RNA polymerase sigma factor (sigma-70 family)